jgi:hypothetical protein
LIIYNAIMTQKDLFVEISVSIKNIIPAEEKFNEAVLNIMRLTGSVEFTGYYIDESDNKKWLDIFSINLDSSYIHQLYQITQTQPPVHINWNRANFTLYPDNKINVEYIWDEALQNEVDRLNNETT